MTTLANKSLLSGGDNKPLMLEKHLYDSWKSIMKLYMMNRPHGRMILASVEKETIQADCDIKAINIILQGLPTEINALGASVEYLGKQSDWLRFTTAKGEDTCPNQCTKPRRTQDDSRIPEGQSYTDSPYSQSALFKQDLDAYEL
ncbi:hypothetical protein Tco_0127686 [Tanacetum coccineum]